MNEASKQVSKQWIKHSTLNIIQNDAGGTLRISLFLYCRRLRATPAATLGLGLVNRSNSFQNNRQQSLLPPVLRPQLWELLRERHLVASLSGMCLGREIERCICARGQPRCQKGARCTWGVGGSRDVAKRTYPPPSPGPKRWRAECRLATWQERASVTFVA